MSDVNPDDLLRVTLASIGDALVTTDAAGGVTYLNPIAEDLTGWTLADARGRPLAEIFRIVNEYSRAPVDSPADRALREGVVVGLANHTILIARDGAERPIDDSAAPIRDSRGTIVGVVLVFRDVTERRQRERNLKASEARKAAVLDAALDGIISIDHAGRVLEFNPAAERMFGRTAGDARGQELADLIIPPAFRDAHRRGIAHYLATGEGPVLNRRVELTALRADGTDFPVELSITPVTGDGPPTFTGYIRDITERKRAEAKEAERVRLTALRAEVAGTLATAGPLPNVLRRCCEAFVERLGVAFARVWVLEEAGAGDAEEGGTLALKASAGLYTHLDGGHARVPVGSYKIGRIARDRRPLLTNDVAHDPNVSDPEWARREGMVSFAGFPLLVEGRCVGVLGMFGRTALSDAVLDDLAPLAEQVAGFVDRKRVEGALRESELRYRMVGEAANDAIWDWEFATNRVTWNEGVRTRFGYAAEQVGPDASWWVEQIHPEDRERVAHGIHAVIDGVTRGNNWEDEYRFRRGDGSYATVFDRGRVVREDGGSVRMVGSMFDLTERNRVERERAELSGQRQIALDAARLGWWRYDPASGETSCDGRYREIFGVEGERRDVEETLGFLHPDDLPQVRTAVAVALDPDDPRPYAAEYRVNRPDGEVRWVEAHGLATFEGLGADRRATNLVGTVADVTERKRAEERLRASEKRVRLAAEAAELGIWTWHVAEDRVTWENDRLYEIFGHPRDAEPINAERFVADFVHPDDAPAFERAIAETLQRDARFYFLGRFRRGDGEIRWTEFTGRLERDDAGAPLRVLGTAADITERKRVEAARWEAEEKFRLMADTIPQLAWMARPDGHIFWYNRRWYEYTGTTLEQMEGRGWQSVHDPRVLPAVLEGFKASLSAGDAFDMIFPLRGKDGVFRPFLTRMNPLRGEDGEIRFWFGTNTDVSEQERTQAELRTVAARLSEADRRKDEFLATLAHELRNPLAPIRSGLEVLRLAGDAPDAIAAVRETMERQTRQMTRLIDDLLDVSRITRGKLQLRRGRVELAEVVRSAVEAVRPALDEARHKLTLSLPKDPVPLDADAARLAQIFSNLLGNAIKYTPPGGRLSLAAAVAPGSGGDGSGGHGSGGYGPQGAGEVVVAVRDNGLGIPAEKQESIFGMFNQLDRDGGEEGYAGLGIGLTMVKSLVELHGGEVSVHSDGAGRGSEFRVRLPLPGPTPRPRSEPESDEAGERAVGRSYRVLVVDDNRAAARMLGMVVKMLGHEVRTAHDGLEAVSAAADFRPALVLMDLGMPNLNGYEAARRIRDEPWGGDMLLAALTGWGQQEDRRRTAEAGFDRHLVKPAEPAALRELFAALGDDGASKP